MPLRTASAWPTLKVRGCNAFLSLPYAMFPSTCWFQGSATLLASLLLLGATARAACASVCADAGASLKERLKRTQALVYVQRASCAALNASSAALSASSAVLATPAQLARSAGAYVADVSAYVATERQALLAAALGWAVWPITIASCPIKVGTYALGLLQSSCTLLLLPGYIQGSISASGVEGAYLRSTTSSRAALPCACMHACMRCCCPS